MDTYQIVLIICAVFLVAQQSMLTAHTTFYALMFKALPIVLAFLLVLCAFEVL